MIDLRHKLPPIQNQGIAPICAAVSAKAVAFYHGIEIDENEVYEEAKKIDKIPGEKYDGTEPEAVLKVLENRGLGKVIMIPSNIVDDVIESKGPVICTMQVNKIEPKCAENTYHAMVVCGYSPMTDSALIRNSWGVEWQDNGHKTMPMAEFIEYAEPYCYGFIPKAEQKSKVKPFIIIGAVVALIAIAAIAYTVIL